MKPLLVAFMLVAWAGCTEAPEAPAPEPEPAREPGQATEAASVSWPVGVHLVLLSFIDQPTPGDHAGNPFMLANVTAVVDWTCTNPVCPLTIELRENDNTLTEMTGDAPLTLTLGRFGGDGIDVWAWPAFPGVTLDAAVEAQVTFDEIIVDAPAPETAPEEPGRTSGGNQTAAQ